MPDITIKLTDEEYSLLDQFAKTTGNKGEVVTIIVHHNREVAECGTTIRKGEEMEASS